MMGGVSHHQVLFCQILPVQVLWGCCCCCLVHLVGQLGPRMVHFCLNRWCMLCGAMHVCALWQLVRTVYSLLTTARLGSRPHSVGPTVHV